MTPTPAPEPHPPTEAAGLLTSGAIYPRRVGLWANKPARPASDRGQADFLAGFKRGAFALYFGDEPIVHFDRDGRWQRAFVAGVHYLKGLDAQVRAVDRVREEGRMVLRRRSLGTAEADRLDAEIADRARELAGALRLGALDLLAPPEPARSIPADELLGTLDRIAAWDAVAWAGHRGRYRRAFGDGPLPLLPPDCPSPLILRPAAGLAPDRFEDHLRDVLYLMGERLDQCRAIYLAGTGWVDRPGDEVAALLATIADRFPAAPPRHHARGQRMEADGPRFEAIHGAIDDPAAALGRRHDWADWRRFRLGRVAIHVADSPGSWEAVPTLAEQLKAARLGVVLMLALDEATGPDRARAVADLPLTRGDLIALIGAAGDEPAPGPLDPGEWRDRLAARRPEGGPRVVAYNPDKQWL